ncbi:TGF-beta receptor type-2 isoform X1 [Engraulis encrasicolus]|uniref:TGF-beta receptor type-2 isoform X1 n=1 Tax=Engraulis encrasicolus TaxID=184585 RepID=UPI002FD6FCD5
MSFNVCKWCDYSSPVCEDHVCTSNCNLTSFCSLAEEVCVAIWRKENDTVSVRTLCHPPQQALDNIILTNDSSPTCTMLPQAADNGLLFVCACVGDHECNDKLIFDKGVPGYSKINGKDVIPVVVISLVPPLLVAILATAAFYIYRTRHLGKQPKDWAPKRTNYQSLDPPEGRSGEANGGSGYPGKLTLLGEDGLSSDLSSTRANCLNHNTEQLPIQLEALVGKGRFAEVWRARLKHSEGQYESVAVKIFPAVEYASWRNERHIFSDANLKHENVVQFLTAEERGGGGGGASGVVGGGGGPQRQYWLIMAYYTLGNLQDYLASRVLSWAELCCLAGSVARGLAHLHSDTTPCGASKVPVAHRDLKSSNIVVKDNLECALCDFGLALRLDLSLTVDDFANSGQVGTARYMAPEVLESRVNLEDLESFKQMDVYSMALVLWEMVSRCEVIGGDAAAVRYHHRVLGPRPRGPSHGPLRSGALQQPSPGPGGGGEEPTEPEHTHHHGPGEQPAEPAPTPRTKPTPTPDSRAGAGAGAGEPDVGASRRAGLHHHRAGLHHHLRPSLPARRARFWHGDGHGHGQPLSTLARIRHTSVGGAYISTNRGVTHCLG